MANSSGEGNYITKLSDALSALPAGIVEFFLALNIFLSITASLGNVLALTALHRVTSIYPPTKLFFRCLAVTDLCVGLIVQPLYVYATYIMSHAKETNPDVLYYVYNVCGALSRVLCGVSIFTSTAIAVDRLLALLLRLRYRHMVTLRRVRVVIICFWVLRILNASVWLWREDIFKKMSAVRTALCLATSICSYVKIYLKLRQQHAQIQNRDPQGQPNGGGNQLNIERYKKTVSTIFWVQLALVVCYAPYIIMAGTAAAMDSGVVWVTAATLVFLNSSLNPILYCWKIREVRQAVKDTIRQLFCC